MATNARDNFSPTVISLLKERAGNCCSQPDCRVVTIGPTTDSNKTASIGVAAHITAAAANGPRYDATLTSEQRSSADNGIWLCQSCARLIDVDILRFPVTLLQQWKAEAVEQAKQNIGKRLFAQTILAHKAMTTTVTIVVLMVVILLFVIVDKDNTNPIMCEGDNCLQIGQIDGRPLHLTIEKGVVNINVISPDKAVIANNETKIRNLQKQINQYLVKLKVQKEVILNDKEKIKKLAEYANKLLTQLDQRNERNERIVLPDQQHELTQRISKAKENFDVPLIKQLLMEKQQLDDSQAAATAFELAKYQEIDLEYAEAYRNNKKAVYLSPNNRFYLNRAAIVARELTEYEGAIRYFERALDATLKSDGKDHPHVAVVR